MLPFGIERSSAIIILVIKNHRIFCGKSNTSERGLGPSIHRSMNGINTHVEVLKFHKKHGQIMIQSTADSLYLGRKVRML